MSLLLLARALARRSSHLAAASLAAVMMAGCDSAPGPASLSNRPPLVSNLVYAPGVVDAGDGALSVSDGSVSVPLTVQSSAVDPDGAVVDVLFVVEAPGLARRVVLSGAMESAGDGRYLATATLSLPVEEPGLYALMVFATDNLGRLSNQVRGSIRLIAPPPSEGEEVGSE